MREFINQIDDYTGGATGTLTTPSGQTVGYEVTDGSINQTEDSFNSFYGDLDAAAITGGGSVEVTFDQPVRDLILVVAKSDVDEDYFITIDGQDVNLNDAIADGTVTFSTTLDDGSPGNHVLEADGRISSSGIYTDGSVAEIRINIGVTSVGMRGTGDVGNDLFEVGFASTTRVVCFAAGVRLSTLHGDKAVEDLAPGDLIHTADHGLQPLRLALRTHVHAEALAREPRLRPVRLEPGALGPATPARPTRVSQQHRFLVRSKIAQRMFGHEEVLVPAVRLTDLPDVSLDEDAKSVTYFHLVFDRHEIVFADGAPSESLLPGPLAISALSPAARAELLVLWPELVAVAPPDPARAVPPRKRVRRLVARHLKNGVPILSDTSVKNTSERTKPMAMA